MALVDLGKIVGTLELDVSKFNAAAGAAAGQLAGLRSGLNGMGAAAKKNGDAATEALKRLASTGNKFQTLGNTITSIGRDLTVGLTLPIAALGGGALFAAIKFESAFAGIRKTVDATDDEFDLLKKQILDMSKIMPVAASKLALFGELAGQMGVKVADLPNFISVIAELGVTTNLVGEDGALMIARFLRVMGLANSQARQVSDVLVDLGNKVAARENEIALMALRIAAAGRDVGMTADDVLGLAGALTELGIRSEMGGSGISRVIRSMNRAVMSGGMELQTFAGVAGMAMQDFATLAREDAGQALLMFLDGLRRMSEEGKNTAGAMDILKLNSIRVQDVMTRSALNVGQVAYVLSLAREQFKTGGATAEEFSKKLKTTESQLLMTKGKVVAVAIALGDSLMPMLLALLRGAVLPLIYALKLLVGAFNLLPPPVQVLITGFVGLLAIIGPLVSIVGAFIASWGKLLVAFSFAKTLFMGGALFKGLTAIGVLLSPGGQIALGIASLVAGLGLIHWLGTKLSSMAKSPLERHVTSPEYQKEKAEFEMRREQEKAMQALYSNFPFLDPSKQKTATPGVGIPLAKGRELRERALEITKAQHAIEKAQQDLQMARLSAKTTEIELAEHELALAVSRLRKEQTINEAHIARNLAAKARMNDPAKAAEIDHEIKMLQLANERMALEIQTAEAQADKAIGTKILAEATRQLGVDTERLEQDASTAAEIRQIQHEMNIAAMERAGATQEQIERAKLAFQLEELNNNEQLLHQKYSLLEAEKALALDESERQRLDTAMQGITGELSVLEARKAQIQKQASEVGTAFGAAFAQGFTDMFTSIMEGGGFLNSFQTAMRSIGMKLLEPVTAMLTQQLQQALSSLLSGIGTSLGTIAQGAIGLALIGLSSLFNQQKAEVESLGDQALQGIESIERTRGLIAGEQNIAIAALSQNLGEAFRPTNEILLRIEMVLRAAALGAPLPGEDESVSLTGIFAQELLGSARF